MMLLSDEAIRTQLTSPEHISNPLITLSAPQINLHPRLIHPLRAISRTSNVPPTRPLPIPLPPILHLVRSSLFTRTCNLPHYRPESQGRMGMGMDVDVDVRAGTAVA